MKTVTLYAPIKFSLVDLMQGKAVHTGEDGAILALQNQEEAQNLLDKLTNTSTKRISAFGCGPKETQHVTLPNCTCTLVLQVPADILPKGQNKIVLPTGIDDKSDRALKPEWIERAYFRIGEDVSHEPMHAAQILHCTGLPIDYHDLRKHAEIRFNDLTRIVEKITTDSHTARCRADLEDEHAKDALRMLFNSTGFVHKRISYDDNMPEAQKNQAIGLEYFQNYMKALSAHLEIDGIIRHVDTMEQEFRDAYPTYLEYIPDAKQAAASATAHVMQSHLQNSYHKIDIAVFHAFYAQAEQDVRMFEEMTQEI